MYMSSIDGRGIECRYGRSKAVRNPRQCVRPRYLLQYELLTIGRFGVEDQVSAVRNLASTLP